MRLRHATTLVVVTSLMLPVVADAKILTVIKSRTKANPAISASGFLEFPKDFRVTVTANKSGMRLAGSFATVQCSHGDKSKTKSVQIKGTPRVTKKFKPSMKHSQACFVSISVIGDRPGKVTVKLEGKQRKQENKPPAAAVSPEPEPTPEVPAA